MRSQETLKLICKSILEKIRWMELFVANTTVNHNEKNGSGGLSGAPLKEKANENLNFVRNSRKKFPIIASGGVMSAQIIKKKLN